MTTTTTFSINGVALTMALDIDSGVDYSAFGVRDFVTGTVTLPDGTTVTAGGGAVHSAASAGAENSRCGRQTDLPGLSWPGEVSPGDFSAYEGYENFEGSSDAEARIAAACGLGIDRDTEEGDANWREIVDAVRDASQAAWDAHHAAAE